MLVLKFDPVLFNAELVVPLEGKRVMTKYINVVKLHSPLNMII